MKPQQKSSTSIRQSKYRNIFGQPFQPVDCIKGVSFGTVTVDSSPLAVTPTWSAAVWKNSKAIGVWKTDLKGTLDGEAPMIVSDSKFNDIALNPFKHNQIITGDDEGMINGWEFDSENGITADISKPSFSIQASEKRIVNVGFHELAENVLVSADSGKVMKLWDLSTQECKVTLPELGGQVINWSWNKEGSSLAVLAKDKNLRIFDVRAGSETGKVADHQGAKSGRVLWLPTPNKILTVGFAKGVPDRVCRIYDPANLSTPLSETKLDANAQSPVMFYDDDNGVFFLSGKGNGTIDFFEVESDKLFHLGNYKAKDAGSSYVSLPKRCVDVRNTEIFRILQLTASGQVVPIKFIVPRRENQFFQDDIFPDCPDGTPSMSSSEWFNGANKPANLMSLKFDD